MKEMGLRNMKFLGFMFLNGLLLCMAQYDFVVKDANFTRHCTTKSMLTVNGMFPGPTLTVHEGDKVNVTIHNQGTYGITIHWHGVKQPRNPWHDGPEYITQCPIQPNASFTQEIIFSDEIGTLWWHAHSDWSRATVHGPIIIHPPKDIYPKNIKFDFEQTLVIATWYDGDVVTEFEKVKNHTEPDDPDAYTINGYVGNYTSSCSNETTFTMSVVSKKTYFLRIINAVLNEEMFFSIANHSLRVVGMDGAYIKPIHTDYILMAPGNTMDVLVTAKQSGGSYYMAAGLYKNGIPPISTAATTAIFKYETPSTPVYPNDTLPDSGNTTKAEAFFRRIKSSTNQTIPIHKFKRYYTTLAVYANQTASTINATMSNISFVSPSTDFMLNSSFRCVTRGKCNGVDRFPLSASSVGTLINGSKVLLVKHNDVVEIVFQGSASGAEDHPMHLHGHSFYLLGRRFNVTFNESYDPYHYYNTKNPPLLNTVSVPYQGWAAIRFVANNPGITYRGETSNPTVNFTNCHLKFAIWSRPCVRGVVHPLSFGTAYHLGYGHCSYSHEWYHTKFDHAPAPS